MRTIGWLVAYFLAVSVGSAAMMQDPAGSGEPPSEVSWPREFSKDGKTLVVYPPQVDSWTDYTTLRFRCAISVEGVLAEETFGVVEGEAHTVVDHALRMVAIIPTKREYRFANVSASDKVLLEATITQLNPPGSVINLSLDRVIAYLNPSQQAVQKTVPVKLDPPKIVYSPEPAVLLSFLGKPMLEPIDKSMPQLQFVINTNWDVLYDDIAKEYFVLVEDQWLKTRDLLNGPYSSTTVLPVSFGAIPSDGNWADVRAAMPAKLGQAPKVVVTTEPTEMIVTEGRPAFRSIPGTSLSAVTNTESVVFLHADQSRFYYLVAGRWFSAPSLDGPWAAASEALPKDFAMIPDGDPADFIKASVPGTDAARDAVLLASIPNTTVVELTEKPIEVEYLGEPKFAAIDGTSVLYATNTDFAVFLVDGAYYCCYQGVWFTSRQPNGPWTFATSVPQAIYAIPPTHPNYNVTYVIVQSSTPTTVTYSQTSGYSGEYVAATGVVMFGMGLIAGAAIANSDNIYIYSYPPRPTLYSYGCGAMYHYGYGGYYTASHRYYGPYGGAGYATAYNPVTGAYQRSAYAYGPRGTAHASAAYNPYTGVRAAGGEVRTAYGSAGRAAAYNRTTGTYARAGYSSGQYGSSGFAQVYNPRTGQGASAGAVSTDRGDAAGFRTTGGAAGATWDTDYGQGTAAKTRSGNVYASNGDAVYRRDADGNWSSNSGNGWESVARPEPTASTSRSFSRVQADAQARDRGSSQAQRSRQFGSSGGGRTGGGRR